MKRSVKELAALCGVSVRTLHYYDEIGLLPPSGVDPHNGYRYYDESSLERLQAILFYRSLDFSLKQIAVILSSPQYDSRRMLQEQKHLLLLEKQRLEHVIAAIENLEKGGASAMHNDLTTPIHNDEWESMRQQYKQEAQQRWGQTTAYQEFNEKTAGQSAEQQQNAVQGLEDLMEEAAALCQKGVSPTDPQAQDLAARWQQHITDHYYTCTDAILAGLGEMYVTDERFRSHIDRHGAGTADYLHAAIRAYLDLRKA